MNLLKLPEPNYGLSTTSIGQEGLFTRGSLVVFRALWDLDKPANLFLQNMVVVRFERQIGILRPRPKMFLDFDDLEKPVVWGDPVE